MSKCLGNSDVQCVPGLSISLVNHVVQPTSYPETIEEEGSEAGSPGEDDPSSQMGHDGWPPGGLEPPPGSGEEQSPEDVAVVPTAKPEDRDAVESRKRRRLAEAGIKVMPAAQRFARLALPAAGWPGWPSACPQVWNRSSEWTSHLVSPVAASSPHRSYLL